MLDLGFRLEAPERELWHIFFRRFPHMGSDRYQGKIETHIYREDKTYVVRVSSQPVVRAKSLQEARNLRDAALRARAEAKAQRARVQAGEPSWADCEQALLHKLETQHAPATWHRANSVIEHHFKAWKPLPVASITGQHLVDYRVGLLGNERSGLPAKILRKDGRPYSPTTVKGIMEIARRVLSYAVARGWLSTVPKEPDTIRTPMKRPEVKLLTAAEMRQLEANAHRLAATHVTRQTWPLLLEIAYVACPRAAEVPALLWEDVDFADYDGAGSLTIRRALRYGNVVDPKTGKRCHPVTAGGRKMDYKSEKAVIVVMTKRLRKLFLEHRERCIEAQGGKPQPTHYVFSHGNEGMSPYNPYWASYAWSVIREGVPSAQFPWHGWRHQMGTRLPMLGHGTYAIADRLGNDPGTVVRTYGHSADTETPRIVSHLLERPDEDDADND